VGLGSGDSSAFPLVQAGSDSYDYGPGYPAYYVWWEVYPQISAQHVNVSVYAADHVSVYVSENSTTGTMRIIDTDRSLDVTYTYKGSWNYSGQAEWIYERPLINGGIPQLADAPPTFNNAQAAYSGSYHSVGSLTHYFDRMYDCTDTTLLASPGSISANGLSYSEIFYNHGQGNNC
jgi:hypothetical protein